MAENGPPQPIPPPSTPAPPSSPAPKRSALPQAWWIVVGLLVVVGLYYLTSETSKTISFTEFDRLAGDGQLKKLTIQGKQRAEGEVRDPNADNVKELKLGSGGKFSINLPATNDQNQLIERLQAKDKAHRDKLKAAAPGDATPEIQLVVSDEAPQILGEYGNTASAGSLIAFALHHDDLPSGAHGVMASFGAGYSLGSALLRRL